MKKHTAPQRPKLCPRACPWLMWWDNRHVKCGAGFFNSRYAHLAPLWVNTGGRNRLCRPVKCKR